MCSLTIQQFKGISRFLFPNIYKYFFTDKTETEVLTPEDFLNKTNINERLLSLVPRLPINTRGISTRGAKQDLTETGLLAFGVTHELLVTAFLEFVPEIQHLNSSFDFLIFNIPFELKTINYSLNEINNKYGLLLTEQKLKINNLHIFILNSEGLFLLKPPFKYQKVSFKPSINKRDYVGIDVSSAIKVLNIQHIKAISGNAHLHK